MGVLSAWYCEDHVNHVENTEPSCLKTVEMNDFGSSLPSYSSRGNDSSRVMDQVRSQIAVASAQELIQARVYYYSAV